MQFQNTSMLGVQNIFYLFLQTHPNAIVTYSKEVLVVAL